MNCWTLLCPPDGSCERPQFDVTPSESILKTALLLRNSSLFIPQDLLDPARWKMLIQQFRYDNYRLHQLGNNSVFTITLQAGLSAIKTPYPTTITLFYICWVLSFQIFHNVLWMPKKKMNSMITDILVLNLMFISSQCYKEDGTSKNPDCPVCSKSLNKLAQPLPMAHCANSRLVCKISGEVMNENNPPMMLPNGYVYGYNVSTLQK